MFNLIIFLFMSALLAPLVHRRLTRFSHWILSLGPLVAFLFFISHLWTLQGGQYLRTSIPWIPGLGLHLSFYLDGLSMIFSLLVSGIGILVVIYAGGYLRGDRFLGRFYAYLLFFTASMLGLILSDNIFSLFVFWELTSITSYLLIGFKNEKARARKAALQALLVTGAGGMTLLVGFILLSQVTQQTELSAMMSSGGLIHGHSFYRPVLVLILLGAFTKSAQFPFHFWLPGAMEAPTPVSAYLHSATMVKAGVYLLARLNPMLGGTDEWHFLVTLCGAATMLIGGILALPQKDLKRLLAYSTVSALGTLIMLLGLSTELATKAAIVFLLVHSLYKGSLFMMAGAVEHETGTRDVSSLGGLIRVMPVTAVAAGLAALSMSGFPPLLGFISKELLYEAKLQLGESGYAVLVVGVLANMINVAVAVTVGVRPFVGKTLQALQHVREAPAKLWLGPVVLAGLGLLFGLYPGVLSELIVSPALTAVHAEHTVITLKRWHGLNLAFMLSVVTVVSGIVLFSMRPLFRRLSTSLSPLAGLGPSNAYEKGLEGLLGVAGYQTRLFQNGYLRYYLITIFATVILLVGYQLVRLETVDLAFPALSISLPETCLIIVMLAATLFVLTTDSRMTAVIALGVIGYGISLIFIFYGAPDLAITQLLVETLTVILFVLVVYRLPRFGSYSSRGSRLRDAVIAVSAGLVLFGLFLKTTAIQFHPSISSYFAQNSVLLAHGRNVVNVILVDFRALDTLGEISVLAVAAVGVGALLGMKKKIGGRT